MKKLLTTTTAIQAFGAVHFCIPAFQKHNIFSCLKYYLCLLLISFGSYTAHGQPVFRPKKPVKSYRESIDKHERVQLTVPIPFSAVRIIDSRYDTTGIGFYLDGYLTLKGTSQPDALQHVIDKYYQSLYTPGKDTLLIQLEELSIQDKLIDNDDQVILTAGHISCKQFIGRNNAYTYYDSIGGRLSDTLSSLSSFEKYKHGFDYNFEYWDHYLLRLCEMMIKGPFAAIDSSTYGSYRHFTVEEIRQSGLEKRNKPILTETNLKPGIYNNFSEFVNNKPSIPSLNIDSIRISLPDMNSDAGNEDMHSDAGNEDTHYTAANNAINYHKRKEIPDTGYWGFCDGTNVYIRYQYDFFQLERKDGSFYNAATLDALRRKINKEGGNILLGLAGLSLSIAAKSRMDFSGFNNTRSHMKIPMIVLNLEGRYILGVQLDMNTGMITY